MHIIHPKELLAKEEQGITKFNTWLALLITNHVGTMYCAYLFAVIGVMGVAGALTDDVKLVLIVGAVSGYFLQLVLLPIIMVGQNVIQAQNDAKADADHQNLLYLVEIQKEQLEILKELKERQQ